MSEWLKPSVQIPHENGEVLCADIVRTHNPFYVININEFHNGSFFDRTEGNRKYTPDLWMPIHEFPPI